MRFSTNPSNENDNNSNNTSPAATTTESTQDAWREFTQRQSMHQHPVLQVPSQSPTQEHNETDTHLSTDNADDQLKHPYILPGTDFTQLYHPDLHLAASAPRDWTGYEDPTPLSKALHAQIAVTGRPISVADYMRACLQDPEHGYYTQNQSYSDAQTDDFDKLDEWEREHQSTEAAETPPDHDPTAVIGGDFVTAPEMTQMFGECLGIWMTLTADQQKNTLGGMGGKNCDDWQYVEAGPGKGSLLVDLLRYWEAVSKGSRGRRAMPSMIHLLETSPTLRQTQKERIQKDAGDLYHLQFHDTAKANIEILNENNNNKPTVQIYWHDNLATFRYWQEKNQSALATFFVCQEFMDALPIYAFEKTKDGWRERLVDVALRDDLQKREEEEHGVAATQQEPPLDQKDKPRLRIVLAPEVTDAAKTLLRLTSEGLLPSEAESGLESPVGTIMEVNPEAMAFTQDMAKIVTEQGGGALIVDYGQEGSRDSIRAYGQHKQLHFLSSPGQVDVTADVDFGALRQVVNSWPRQKDAPSLTTTEKEPAHAFGPTPQGPFLMTMGIKERAIRLSEEKDTTQEQQEAIYTALVRLCSAEEMGERFKVMAIVPSNRGKVSGQLQPPPGFEA